MTTGIVQATAPGLLEPSQPTRLLIGGAWRDAAGGASFPVRDPASEQVIASVADGGAEDARTALGAAASAAADWAAVPPRRRGELLRAAFDVVSAQAEMFARTITAEGGKPLADSRAEVAYGAEFLRWFGEEAVRLPGRVAVAPEGTTEIVVTSRPVGPCYLVTPWNFPLAMVTRKVAPALAAGCTVVLKPADATPLTALLLARVLVEVGLPAGVVNVVTASRPAEISRSLVADDRLRKLSFTGSTAVGRELLAQAAPRVLRTSMELGGNAPFLVFDDADLDAALDGAMVAKFRGSGQACTAANRFLVQRGVYQEFVDRLAERVRALRTGPGDTEGTDIGPMINARSLEKLARLVNGAVTGGARVLVGGHRLPGPGYFFAPTLVVDVDPGSEIAREEIFGPVLAVTAFDDEAEAVRLANETDYGLSSYLYTRDLARAHRLVEALDAGMTGVNTGLVSNAAAPFGGVKQSGTGREGGGEGIREYLEVRYAAFAR